MGLFSPPSPSERERLARELAELKGEVHALRSEKDRTADVNRLNAEVERIKLEKGRLIEEHDRKVRETEHKVGLLKLKQEQELANAKRQTELEVREQNLAADKKRFESEMTFQRTHLQEEISRIDGILTKVLDRLPDVNASLRGKVGS
jgi:hypothetical protein